ncbi:Uncharacterised protein [Sebaldella termitidis]|uniref:Uncharacterized protein n=1 Tax=Sebaldella termitidis (strain ATCC 33386 / NCTC 11300) TaxID=526218 RepID=D1AHJ1_SEBTE|nr:hypothetical protein [Sebaldella termitidis]ACZ08225.1 hypothetical protein Sterm_1360 [Sebaldella termitidis ATCC 33386]SUI23529.1 Uncharacterised protein [Sebaldella termitidis]
MKEFSLTYLVSILSVFISSATAVFLSIIAYKQNKKLNLQKEEHDRNLTRQKNEFDKEITRLSGSIERMNFVHKTQFDTEFELYKKIWLEISNITKSFHNIQDHLTELNSTDNDCSEANKALKNEYNLLKSYSSVFSEIIDKNRPFYFQELYSLLIIFSNQSKILAEYLSNDDYQKIDLDSYLYEMVKLLNFSVSIEEIIRNRIENLKIV